MCDTGKYTPFGNQNCPGKITLKRRHGTQCWYMDECTRGKCTCFPPSDGIDLLTLINLPAFHAQVKINLNGNKPMKINDSQFQDLVPKQHGVEMMNLTQFATALRAVVHYMQTEVLKKISKNYPSFSNCLFTIINIPQVLFYKQNKATTFFYGF